MTSPFEPRKRPAQKRAQATVDKILNGAMSLLSKKGAENFSTYLIAEYSGVNAGSIYQYFSNKEQIIYALYEREIKAAADVLRKTLEDKRTNLPLEEYFRIYQSELKNVGWSRSENIELKRALASHPELRNSINDLLGEITEVTSKIFVHYGSSWTREELAGVTEILFELSYLKFDMADREGVLGDEFRENIFGRCLLDLIKRVINEPSPSELQSS